MWDLDVGHSVRGRTQGVLHLLNSRAHVDLRIKDGIPRGEREVKELGESRRLLVIEAGARSGTAFLLSNAISG